MLCSLLLTVLVVAAAAENRLDPEEIGDVVDVQMLTQQVFGRRLNLRERRMHTECGDNCDDLKKAAPPEMLQVSAGIPDMSPVQKSEDVPKSTTPRPTRRRTQQRQRPARKIQPQPEKKEELECDDEVVQDGVTSESKVVPLLTSGTPSRKVEVEKIKEKVVPPTTTARPSRKIEVEKVKETKRKSISSRYSVKNKVLDTEKPVKKGPLAKKRVEEKFNERDFSDEDEEEEEESESYFPPSRRVSVVNDEPAVYRTVHIQHSIIRHSVLPED